MKLESIEISSLDIDLGSLELDQQKEAFQELLETVPDKALAEVFIQSASSELMDLLKDHFIEQFDLHTADELDESKSEAKING